MKQRQGEVIQEKEKGSKREFGRDRWGEHVAAGEEASGHAEGETFGPRPRFAQTTY